MVALGLPFMLKLVLLSIAESAAHCSKGQPCWDLFDQTQLRKYDLAIAPSDWAKLQVAPNAKKQVPCNVTVNAGTDSSEVFIGCGCRYKGHGSLGQCTDPATGAVKENSASCRKASFKVSSQPMPPRNCSV